MEAEVSAKEFTVSQLKAAVANLNQKNAQMQDKIPPKGYQGTSTANMVIPQKKSWAQLKNTPAGTEGKWGGVSPYDDDDVIAAVEYMQEVLGVQSMEINGRALEHILAEVRGFAGKENKIASQGYDAMVYQFSQAKDKLKNQETVNAHLQNLLHQQAQSIAKLKGELTAEMEKPKWQEVTTDHVPTDTTRRIKDDY
jgi:hypothetical protein